MDGRDPWADFEAEPGPAEPEKDTEPHAKGEPEEVERDEAEEKLHSLAEQLFLIEEDLETGREERRRCVKEIVGTWPEGSFRTRDFGDYQLEIERSERWTWDKAKLAQILAEMGQEDAELPAFVDRAVRIDREMFETAPPNQRASFEPALNRGRGPVKITVTRKGS